MHKFFKLNTHHAQLLRLIQLEKIRQLYLFLKIFQINNVTFFFVI